jgi:hypothetical protein
MGYIRPQRKAKTESPEKTIMPSEPTPGTPTFSITFPEESGHNANAAAASLAETLRDVDASLVVSRDKADPNTQDPGSVLTVVLGSAPAAAVAAGIAAWIRMRRLVVVITTQDRSIEVTGSGTDAAKVIESIFKRS